MTDRNQVIWTGSSGRQYTYWYHAIGSVDFLAQPGNYIYSKLTPQGWVAVYIGETGNLSDRIARHEKRERALRHGATHIHAHTSSDARVTRLNEETDLRHRCNPPCNDQ